MKSCTVLGVQADGAVITTIEGLASNGELHPVQQAFHDHHALQCGYCTPGMVMAAVSLIESGEATDRAAIRRGLEGNLCRCTGYHNIVEAVAAAAGSGVVSATATRHIGLALKRKEDDPLLRGSGTYVDNIDLPGTVVMAVVRSPYAHARIASIDTTAALASEGVVAVFTGADLRDDWKAAMPCAWPVTEDMKSPEHFPLAVAEAHYQGDGVAVVIADTRAHAVDAAELVEVDYEPLDVIVDVEAAAQDGATLVHEELGTNVSYVWKLATGTFDEGADVIVKHRYVQPPLIPSAIEPRGVIARPEPGGDVTLWSATQIPHILRLLTAATLGMSETKLRVIAPDVGGGFGSKLDVYAEELLAVALARRLGTPVKWVEERSENATATIHGRDFVTTLELAATKDGKITSLRGECDGLDGGLPSARHAGHPAARRLDLCRAVCDPELRRHVHRCVHEHDPDRRIPWRRAGPRRPTCSSARWTCSRSSSGWIVSSCGGRTSSRSSRLRSPRG